MTDPHWASYKVYIFQWLGLWLGLGLGLGKAKVMSRKFTTCKFVFAVIFRPSCSKTLLTSFLVLSAKRAVCF